MYLSNKKKKKIDGGSKLLDVSATSSVIVSTILNFESNFQSIYFESQRIPSYRANSRKLLIIHLPSFREIQACNKMGDTFRVNSTCSVFVRYHPWYYKRRSYDQLSAGVTTFPGYEFVDPRKIASSTKHTLRVFRVKRPPEVFPLNCFNCFVRAVVNNEAKLPAHDLRARIPRLLQLGNV